MTRPGMYASNGGCARQLGPLLLAGAAIIYEEEVRGER